jgi:PAS domain S-box-containing protein
MKKETKKKGNPAEIGDLRMRLEEAEEALRAIRSGEVDALIVSSPRGEEVFTLKGAEQPYRVFIEAMNEGAVTLDSQGNILYCNNRFAEMLKTSSDKVIGSSIYQFIPPTDSQDFESAFQTGKREETTVDISFRRQDEGFLPVHLSFNALHGQDLPVVCMVAMDLTEHKRYEQEILKSHTELEIRVQERTAELRTEISERKRAEKSLRESEQRWATTLASIGDAVISTCVDGRITFMNAVAEALTGWALNEASQKPVKEVFNIINEHTRLEVEDPVAKVIETGIITGLANHTLLVRKDGTEVAIDDSGAPIKDENGKIMGVVLVFRDISERRRADKETQRLLNAVQQERDWLSALVNSIADEVWFADTEKRFTLANPSALREFGFGSTNGIEVEKLAESLEVYRPDGSPRPIEETPPLRALQGEVVTNQEEIIRTPARGGMRFRQVSAAPVRDVAGKIIGSVSVVRDITEGKRMEEELRKSRDELEMRVQERTSELSRAAETLRVENIQRRQLEDTLRESEKQVRFFASQCLTAQETERKRVAGELHDSVAASLGAMRFRIDKIADEMKQRHIALESLQDLGSKVTEINNEVRRIMADLRPSVLDDLGIIAAMNWFCREYQKTYSDISVEKQIEISEQEVPDSLKTPIFRISQEGMNNIAKHSQASLVNLSLRKEDAKILLTIQDNGQGFNLETVERGLGLSTMRERAQLSGGSFDLESAIEKGTIVRASWPV